MSSNWETVTIIESGINIIDGDRGKNYPKQNEFSQKGYCIFLSTNDIENNKINISNCQYISKDKDASLGKGKIEYLDIILTTRGNGVGKLGLYDYKIPARINSGQVIIRNNTSDFDTKYLFHYLTSTMFKNQIISFSSGSAQPQLPIRDLKQIKIIKPPLQTQKKIAHILSTLDDKIELNRKMNQTLEEMASAIFKSWFVDFDPVHAKANCTDEAELETIAKELGISKAILDLFPSEFIESELGMIPKGWEVKKLEDVSEILNGHAFKSSDYVNDGIFVLRTKNFSNDGYVENANDDVYLPESFLESHGQFLCQPYDFHLVMVGASIGKTSMILPMNLPALRNQNMWCFRPKSELISRVFLSHTVKNVVRLQMGSASGSAREFFTKGSFFAQKVIIPEESILSKYEKITTPILEKIAINQNEIQSLQKTRDTLLPKLLSGEIDVSKLEI